MVLFSPKRCRSLKTDNKIQVVIQEILQDKIYLDTELNVQIAADQQAAAADELDFRNL